MSLTIHSDESVTLSKARHWVCLEAVWELDALALLLPKVTSNGDPEATQAALVVRGVAARIKELSSVLMAGLHDEMETTDALAFRVGVTSEGSANVP